MAVGIRTDPHVRPGGRNDERLDALEYGRTRNRASVRIDIAHALVAADATDAGEHTIVNVMKLRERRGRDGVERGSFRNAPSDEAQRVFDAPFVAGEPRPRRRKRRRPSCAPT